MITTTQKFNAAQDVEVVVTLSKSDFNKGLKLVKACGGKYNGQTKEWTIELDSTCSSLIHPEWNGIELVSVNGFKLGQQAAQTTITATATATPRIARISYNEEDAEDFGYTNKSDRKGFYRGYMGE